MKLPMEETRLGISGDILNGRAGYIEVSYESGSDSSEDMVLTDIVKPSGSGEVGRSGGSR